MHVIVIEIHTLVKHNTKINDYIIVHVRILESNYFSENDTCTI